MNNTQTNRYNLWDVFNPFFEDFFKEEEYANGSLFGLMKTDIIEFNDRYEFRIDVPSISKEDIKISLEEGNLIVAIENKKDEIEGATYLTNERTSGKYSRSYYVGEEYTEEDIKAKRDAQLIKANELLVRMINYQPQTANR